MLKRKVDSDANEPKQDANEPKQKEKKPRPTIITTTAIRSEQTSGAPVPTEERLSDLLDDSLKLDT